MTGTKNALGRIASVVAALCALAAAGQAHAGAPVEVEVTRGADDDVTTALAAAVMQAFGNDDGFALSQGRRANSLIVVVQAPTAAARAGIHYKLAFPIRFLSAQGQTLGFTQVTCQENTLNKCANQTVAAAGPAANKLGRH
ncbi:hypothetical protein [Nitrospirillum pindoramense]|uniref:Uncharacterized protein n=1 Tax=Nitrospirillum amazonense TaxID=28077 RepID=A0A560HBQ2_9PROT|nr:hypothetical protein [Nitrospirillum amazonense]TWB43797.1 hypothetical protein FBZ90_104185 [Nitrospirillum amazonense]